MAEERLGVLEQQLLWAVIGTGQDAYAVPVQAWLKDRAGKDVSFGTIHTALMRLQRKGFVESRLATGDGQPKRFWRVTGVGARALREADDAMRRCSEGLADLVGGLAWGTTGARS